MWFLGGISNTCCHFLPFLLMKYWKAKLYFLSYVQWMMLNKQKRKNVCKVLVNLELDRSLDSERFSDWICDKHLYSVSNSTNRMWFIVERSSILLYRKKTFQRLEQSHKSLRQLRSATVANNKQPNSSDFVFVTLREATFLPRFVSFRMDGRSGFEPVSNPDCYVGLWPTPTLSSCTRLVTATVALLPRHSQTYIECSSWSGQTSSYVHVRYVSGVSPGFHVRNLYHVLAYPVTVSLSSICLWSASTS